MKPTFHVDIDGTLQIFTKKPKNKREALRWSIAKWKFIVNNIDEIMDDGGGDTCGLCIRYHQDWCSLCKGCPISEYTRFNYCENTPYDDYRNGETLTKDFAQKMLDFLRKLYKKLYGDK